MTDVPPIPPGEPSSTPPPAPPPPGPIDYLGGAPSGDFSWNDFLTFRTMIAVPTIMVMFWVGVVWCLIAGLTIMFTGGGLRGICTGLATIVFGPFMVRLYCEFLIVVFRINETM